MRGSNTCLFPRFPARCAGNISNGGKTKALDVVLDFSRLIPRAKLMCFVVFLFFYREKLLQFSPKTFSTGTGKATWAVNETSPVQIMN